MTFYYRVYGLDVAANDRIPGLVPILGNKPTDLEVFLGSQQCFYFPWDDSESRVDGESSAVIDSLQLKVTSLQKGEYVRLKYVDGTEFTVAHKGTHLWATWPNELTLQDAVTYLLGPVLGFVLRLRGITSLHASAVAIDGKAVALLGAPGAGKSTTAAAFARLGYGVVTDDVLALTDQQDAVVVQPAYPCIRLWPESVRALYGAPDALPLLTPNWDKRYLDLTQPGYHFHAEALPLAAVYVLGERCGDFSAPFIERITSRDGLMALITNSYVNYLLDKPMRAKEFEVLTGLIDHTPVRRVVPHSAASRLPELCEMILDDFHRPSDAS